MPPTEIDIRKLGKGAVLQPEDERDYKAELRPDFIAGAPLIDWEKGFYLEEPPDENQGSSSSCVAQGWSYYHWLINRKNWSRRSLYSRIFLLQGGAYGRDGGKELTTIGQATRDEAPDPSPQTENEMRSREGITAEEEASDIEHGYFSLPSDIDMIAYTIQNYKGSVGGVRGTNKAWADLTNPNVPAPGDINFWYHYLFRFGYHRHNDGQKCIIHKSSWCGIYGGVHHHEHHIKEDYFLSGGTFDNWVLVPKENNKMEFFQVTGEQTLVVRNLDGKYYELATIPEFWPIVAKTFGLEGKNFGFVSRAEVSANYGGKAQAGITFVNK